MVIFYQTLAKWLSVRLRTKWMWFQIPLQSSNTSDIEPVSSKAFLDIQATIECGLTLKRVRDMMRTYIQYLIHCYTHFKQLQETRTDKRV